MCVLTDAEKAGFLDTNTQMLRISRKAASCEVCVPCGQWVALRSAVLEGMFHAGMLLHCPLPSVKVHRAGQRFKFLMPALSALSERYKEL